MLHVALVRQHRFDEIAGFRHTLEEVLARNNANLVWLNQRWLELIDPVRHPTATTSRSPRLLGEVCGLTERAYLVENFPVFTECHASNFFMDQRW